MNDPNLEKANKYFKKITHYIDLAHKNFSDEDYYSCTTNLEIFKINLDFLNVLLEEIQEKENANRENAVKNISRNNQKFN
jgi:hypothetical protein